MQAQAIPPAVSEVFAQEAARLTSRQKLDFQSSTKCTLQRSSVSSENGKAHLRSEVRVALAWYAAGDDVQAEVCWVLIGRQLKA